MRTFTFDRMSVAYRDEGTGDPIVFLHNGGTSSVIWREQVAALAPTHRVVAVDLPGFGHSPVPEPPATLTGMVDLIVALIVDLDAGPVTLVGNCMGSNIAVRTARRRPDLVTAVLAVNPLTEASFSGGGLGFTHRMKRLGATPTRLVRAVSRRVSIPRFLTPAVLRFQLGPRGVARDLQHDAELVACQVRPDQMPALVDVLDDMDAYGDLDTAAADDDVPVWVAWGERNRVLSAKKAAGLDDRLHARRVDSIEGTGHLPMLEDPDTVTALIGELIEATASADRAS